MKFRIKELRRLQEMIAALPTENVFLMTEAISPVIQDQLWALDIADMLGVIPSDTNLDGSISFHIDGDNRTTIKRIHSTLILFQGTFSFNLAICIGDFEKIENLKGIGQLLNTDRENLLPKSEVNLQLAIQLLKGGVIDR